LYIDPEPHTDDDDVGSSGIPAGCDRGYSAAIYAPDDGAAISNPVHLEYRFFPGNIPDGMLSLQDETGRYWPFGVDGVNGPDDTLDYDDLEPGLSYRFTLSWDCVVDGEERGQFLLAQRSFYVTGAVVDAGVPVDAAVLR
jgi:hypothetical protein